MSRSQKETIGENCVACAVKAILLFDLSAIVSSRCSHESRPKTLFDVSKLKTTFCALYALASFGKLVAIARQFRTSTVAENFILSVNDLIFFHGHVTTFAFTLTTFRGKIKILLAYQELAENGESFGVKTALKLEDAKRFKTLSVVWVALDFCVMVTFLLLLYTTQKSDWYHWYSAIGSYSQLLSMLETTLEYKILKTYFRRCCEDLKASLSSPGSRENCVRNYRRFHAAIFNTCTMLFGCYSTVFLAWFLQVITVLIFNAYILVVQLLAFGYLELDMYINTLKVIVCFILIFYYIVKVQDLTDSSEDITSFLFRYPISKLSPAEAAQVEMMITTLHVQKPILKASDIFTVGTRLLASISGTVVTYVLVALQFHASWAKE